MPGEMWHQYRSARELSPRTDPEVKMMPAGANTSQCWAGQKTGSKPPGLGMPLPRGGLGDAQCPLAVMSASGLSRAAGR